MPTDVIYELAQSLIQEWEDSMPEYKNRNLSESEKPYFVQLEHNEHFCAGLILRHQRNPQRRMAFASLPLMQFISEMKSQNLDLNFMTYMACKIYVSLR